MKNEINLCFDFDGPVIDVSERYYRAYLDSLKDANVTKNDILTKSDFWKLKQNKVSELEIGIMSGLTLSKALEVADLRKDLTFRSAYFTHDKLFDDVIKTFEYLKSKNITFFIVTLRRKKQLYQAIKDFRLDKYISNESLFAVPDEHKITNDIQEKYILLVNAINKLEINPIDTWMIGDTETDIHASRLARYGKAIAISRGIRSKELLEILKPNNLVNNFSELVNLVMLPQTR